MSDSIGDPQPLYSAPPEYLKACPPNLSVLNTCFDGAQKEVAVGKRSTSWLGFYSESGDIKAIFLTSNKRRMWASVEERMCEAGKDVAEWGEVSKI